MHFLSLVSWIITPLHVSSAYAAHHQEVECIYVANCTCFTSKLTIDNTMKILKETTRARVSDNCVYIYIYVCICIYIQCFRKFAVHLGYGT
jgi:hypothetical protein